MLAAVDALPWDTRLERRRQPYGHTYRLGKGEPPQAFLPLPPWGAALAERLYRDGYNEQPFNQMLVNEYLPGQGIAPHVDYEPFLSVAMISLLSPYVMDFVQPESGEKHALPLERRSLVVLHDDARYLWQHGIARRKKDIWKGVPIARGRRVSITFRYAPD